jgi:hypothetical protein
MAACAGETRRHTATKLSFVNAIARAEITGHCGADACPDRPDFEDRRAILRFEVGTGGKLRLTYQDAKTKSSHLWQLDKSARRRYLF